MWANKLPVAASSAACIGVLRTGAQWREMPERYGKWNTVYKRFARWEEKGVWQALFAHVADDPDLESVMPDGSVIRAPMCAAGGSRKHGSQAEQSLGKSQGGFSTKIHVLVDALGNPLRFRLTGGQRHESTQADALLGGFAFDFVIAAKAYDSDALRKTIAECGAEAVIPPRSNRTKPVAYDQHLYKERHLVECLFNKLKWCRRIATRYDKLAQCYLAFLHFASTLLWLT